MIRIYAALAVVALIGLGGAAAYVIKLERKNVLQGVTDANNRLGDKAGGARDKFDTCPRELWDGPNLRCRGK